MKLETLSRTYGENRSCIHPNAVFVIYDEIKLLAHFGCPDCNLHYTELMTQERFDRIKRLRNSLPEER